MIVDPRNFISWSNCTLEKRSLFHFLFFHAFSFSKFPAQQIQHENRSFFVAQLSYYTSLEQTVIMFGWVHSFLQPQHSTSLENSKTLLRNRRDLRSFIPRDSCSKASVMMLLQGKHEKKLQYFGVWSRQSRHHVNKGWQTQRDHFNSLDVWSRSSICDWSPLTSC